MENVVAVSAPKSGSDVYGRLLEKSSFERLREALAPVRHRPGNTGVATLEELALQRPVGGHDVRCVVVDPMDLCRSVSPTEVAGQPDREP